jgi:hypothetical protein
VRAVVSLQVHKDFQAVQRLPFCYLCGREFVDGDEVDGDHVPPKCAFRVRDREQVLKLKTHKACNSAFKVDDEKVGQLIALRRWEGPKSAQHRVLRFAHHPGIGTALENLNVAAAVWRWVRGFHAALYRKPLIGASVAIQTPFPRGERRAGSRVELRPIPPQHLLAVETIKRNRAAGNLDFVLAYNGKLRHECAWCEADDHKQWFCMFALDIYDWKDLGGHTDEIPARGCTGVYALPDRSVPEAAARGDRENRIVMPNRDALDAFAP